MKNRIYLDNNATTFLDPAVLTSLIAAFQAPFSNPSSVHSYGQAARAALVQARQTIANLLKVKLYEIMFTSGATESLNALIKGVFEPHFKGHLITSNVEHAAVFATCKSLATKGVSVSFLSPGSWGAITVQAVEQAILPTTRLITLMAVNNETGVKTDLAAIANLAKAHQIPLIVDGVALVGKESFDIPAGLTALAFSGHKFHAPKGTGISWKRASLPYTPLIIGGEQETGQRGGTENLPGILALVTALNLFYLAEPHSIKNMTVLRDHLESELSQKLVGIYINGEGPRIGNTSNLAFEGIEGETLLLMLDRAGIAVSHGAACASGALEPSRVLLNMGFSKEHAASSLRFSLSRFTTELEIAQTIDTVCRLVKKLREK